MRLLISLLDILTSTHYFTPVKATLTSKGQITVPLPIRRKFHLNPGDVLDFDENAPFLKASKTIAPQAWDEFGQEAKDPLAGMDISQVMDELRGPVELPPAAKSRA
jgi:AbrB family looped-hinge helix DNA binding protein